MPMEMSTIFMVVPSAACATKTCDVRRENKGAAVAVAPFLVRPTWA